MGIYLGLDSYPVDWDQERNIWVGGSLNIEGHSRVPPEPAMWIEGDTGNLHVKCVDTGNPLYGSVSKFFPVSMPRLDPMNPFIDYGSHSDTEGFGCNTVVPFNFLVGNKRTGQCNPGMVDGGCCTIPCCSGLNTKHIYAHLGFNTPTAGGSSTFCFRLVELSELTPYVWTGFRIIEGTQYNVRVWCPGLTPGDPEPTTGTAGEQDFVMLTTDFDYFATICPTSSTCTLEGFLSGPSQMLCPFYANNGKGDLLQGNVCPGLDDGCVLGWEPWFGDTVYGRWTGCSGEMSFLEGVVFKFERTLLAACDLDFPYQGQSTYWRGGPVGGGLTYPCDFCFRIVGFPSGSIDNTGPPLLRASTPLWVVDANDITGQGNMFISDPQPCHAKRDCLTFTASAFGFHYDPVKGCDPTHYILDLPAIVGHGTFQLSMTVDGDTSPCGF